MLGMATESRQPFSSFSNSLRVSVPPFLLSRLLILLAAFGLQYLLDTGRAIKYDFIGDAPLAPLSANFDANWYNSIAEEGYSTSADVTRQQNYHFFPLFPFLTYAVGKLAMLDNIQGGFAIGGVVLSHLLFLLALVVLHKLTLEVWHNDTLATRSVWLMSVLPWSFVFSMTYTEALFLLLSLAAAMWAYRASRRPLLLHVIPASLLSVLASLTRPQGVIVSLLVMLLVAVVPRGLSMARRIGYATIAVIPAAISVGAFILYTGSRTGNLWAVLQNNRTWGNGWLAELPRIFTLPPANPLWFIDVYATIGLITWVALLVLLTLQFTRTRRAENEAPNQPALQAWAIWPFVAYSWMYFLFTAINSPSNNSWGRYLMVIFPCIWALATITAGSTQRQFTRLVTGGLTLQVLFLAGAVLQQATP